MENASKALLMAAGVLIGVLILSLAVFLFINFGEQAEQIHGEITSNQLTQFNAQFNVYEGRRDVTIYQIVTIANLAYENNQKETDETYKVKVFLGVEELTKEKPDYKELIKNNNNEIEIVDEYGKTTKFRDLFECLSVEYHDNGRVKQVTFKKT